MIVLSFVVQWQRHRQLYCLNLHVAFEKTLSSSDQAIHYFQMKWNGNFQSILLYQRLRLVMDTHLWLLTGEKFLLTCLWLQDIRMICLQLREWNCSFCFCSIMYAFGGFAGHMFNSFLQYSQGKLGELAIHDTRYSGIAGHDINDDMCVFADLCWQEIVCHRDLHSTALKHSLPPVFF